MEKFRLFLGSRQRQYLIFALLIILLGSLVFVVITNKNVRYGKIAEMFPVGPYTSPSPSSPPVSSVSPSSSYPLCGNGLNCSYNNIAGSHKCYQIPNSTETINCCSSGQIIENNTCITPSTSARPIACTWCTNRPYCEERGYIWTNSNGYCAVPGDGCCSAPGTPPNASLPPSQEPAVSPNPSPSRPASPSPSASPSRPPSASPSPSTSVGTTLSNIIKFDGVPANDNNINMPAVNKQKNVRVQIVKVSDGVKIYDNTIKTIYNETNKSWEKPISLNFLASYNGKYVIKLKGPSHRQITFCKLTSQTSATKCTRQDSMDMVFGGGNINLNAVSYPLEFGDINWDGAVGVNDYSFLKGCLLKNATLNTDQKYHCTQNGNDVVCDDCSVADGNFDGTVDNTDVDLLYKTLSTKPDDE